MDSAGAVGELPCGPEAVHVTASVSTALPAVLLDRCSRLIRKRNRPNATNARPIQTPHVQRLLTTMENKRRIAGCQGHASEKPLVVVFSICRRHRTWHTRWVKPADLTWFVVHLAFHYRGCIEWIKTPRGGWHPFHDCEYAVRTRVAA